MAQVVARYLGVVEVASSSLVTPTTSVPLDQISSLFHGGLFFMLASPKNLFCTNNTVAMRLIIRSQFYEGVFLCLLHQENYLITITHQRSAGSNKLPFSRELIFVLFPQKSFCTNNTCRNSAYNTLSISRGRIFCLF